MWSVLLPLLLLQSGDFIYNDQSADKTIRQSMALMYDLQFAQARSLNRELQARYPDHPSGYTLWAETYWWEAQTDPGNKVIEDAYETAHKVAVERSEAAVEKGRYPRTELLAYLASTHGSHARFLVTQRSAFFGAMRAGLRANRYAQDVFKLDRNYYDIYVGIGAYNYFTGALPAVIKPFAFLLGVRGNKELGLEQLRLGIEKSRYSATESKIVYYTALLQEKQYAEAFRVLEELIAAYPHNHVLYTWATDWYRTQTRNLDGAAYFARLSERVTPESPVAGKYALLEKARLEDAHSRPALARETLEKLRRLPGDEPILSKKVRQLESTLARRK